MTNSSGTNLDGRQAGPEGADSTDGVRSNGHATGLRPDLAPLCDWIRPGSRILDLGCGDGELLSYLSMHHGVSGYGLELDPEKLARCVAAGVNVIQSDLDDGLRDFDNGSFDYVVMNLALQALQRPDDAVAEILRVGRIGIVTFPNFGHWRVRAALAAGRMPVTPSLPDHWYDSPNIHLCTVDDFEHLCGERGWRILSRRLLDRSHREGARIRLAPNLFCEIALYMLQSPEHGA